MKAYELTDYTIGMQVEVHAHRDGPFENDFIGTVKEVNAAYIVVEDQDGDCWSCEPYQLTPV